MAGQKPKSTKKNHKLLADRLAEGWPIQRAMRAAGYSEATSRCGKKNIPAAVWAMVPKRAQRLIEKGKHLLENPEVAKHLVMGRLAENTERANDRGTASAKALGSTRGLDMFTPESQTGVIVVVPPAEVADKIDQLLEADE